MSYGRMNTARWSAQIAKILATNLFPNVRHFILLTLIYSPQQSVHNCPQRKFLLYRTGKFFHPYKILGKTVSCVSNTIRDSLTTDIPRGFHKIF
jgi:hypothetical protein